MTYILLLLLLLLCMNTNASSTIRKTYQLYSIPSFTIQVSVEPGIDRTDSDNQLQIFADKLKSLAHAHLFEAFTSELYQYGNFDGENSALDSIELNVAIYDESNGQEIIGELVGHVLFIEQRLQNLNDFEASPAVVRNIVNKAFGREQLDVFFSRLRLLLPNVQTVHVTTDIDENTMEPKVNPTVTTVIKDKASGQSSRGKGWSNVIAVSMAVAVTALAVGLFAYFRHGKRLHKSGHLLMDTDQYSKCSEDDSFFGDLHLLDEASYETYDDEEGLQFVPVPAKYDDNCDKRTKATLKEVTPMRYVQPDSPFQLLYGAAYSHRDAAKVARVHGYKQSKSKYVKVAGKKIKKKPPIQPMQSISEAPEESPNESSPLQVDEDISNNNNTHDDGIPCVVSVSKLSESSPIQVENEQHQITNSDTSPNKDEQIDCFVDKLENLILAKSRHYEELKQLETVFLLSKNESNAIPTRDNVEQLNSVLDDKIASSQLDDDRSHETNHDGSQENDTFGMTDELNGYKVESSESGPLVSTSDKIQLDSVLDDKIAYCQLDDDRSHETAHETNHDGSQETNTFGMTDELNGCKVESSSSELGPLVSTSDKIQLDLVLDDKIAYCQLDDDRSHETAHETNHDGSQETNTFGMTDELNGYKVESSESGPLVSTSDKIQLDLVLDDKIAYCQLDDDRSHETAHETNHNGSQETNTFGMTDELNGCKVESSSSESGPLVSTSDKIKDAQPKNHDDEDYDDSFY